MKIETSLWYTNLSSVRDAPLRLFCFPYAGGSAQVFHNWPQALAPSVEVWALNLPGRGRRAMEPPFTELAALVETITTALTPLLGQPFAFFGHSMGALISYEICRLLRKNRLPLPVHLLASACFAPHIPDPHPLHHLETREFLREVCSFGGMPKEVAENEELLALILPALRADFTMTECYSYKREAPFPCPISVFGGWRDPLTTRESLEAWRMHTNRYFSVRMLPGDHFFIHNSEKYLLDLIRSELSRTGTMKQGEDVGLTAGSR